MDLDEVIMNKFWFTARQLKHRIEYKDMEGCYGGKMKPKFHGKNFMLAEEEWDIYSKVTTGQCKDNLCL